MFQHDLGDGATLRILEKRHAQEFLEFVDENRSHLSEWLGWANEVTTLEQAEMFIQRGLDRFVRDGLPWIGIWLHERLAGGVLFFPLDRRIRATEIGYWLGKFATGRGLITRALRAVLDFAFEELELNRVGLKAGVDNGPSIAVAERLGFTREGVMRQRWLARGQLIDMAVYSMLASEWKQ